MVDDYIFVWSDNPKKKEILMKNSSVTLPTNVPAGSVAYTADMSYVAMFDGTEWKQMGGHE